MRQLLPKVHYETVGLCITPDTLIISWIQRFQGTTPYLLKAYKEITLSPTTFCKGYLFNPTNIQAPLRSFIYSYSLQDAYIVCAVYGPNIQESLSAHLPLFSENQIKQTRQIQQYLYTLENSEKIFYYVRIPSPLILQYTLLALNERLNLIALIPHFTAYLALYQHIYAAAFRRAQLAHDMHKHNNQLYNIFTPEQIKRLITIPTHISHTIAYGIALALGLFIVGTDHETYKLY